MKNELQFLSQYDRGFVDWNSLEEGFHFVIDNEIEEHQTAEDGYVDVELVFEVNGRFFRTFYSMGGKDLDEVFKFPEIKDITEVFAKEVTTTIYVPERF